MIWFFDPCRMETVSKIRTVSSQVPEQPASHRFGGWASWSPHECQSQTSGSLSLVVPQEQGGLSGSWSWTTPRSKAAPGHEVGHDGEAWMGPVSPGKLPATNVCSGAGDVLEPSSAVACSFGWLTLAFALSPKDSMFFTVVSFPSNVGCFPPNMPVLLFLTSFDWIFLTSGCLRWSQAMLLQYLLLEDLKVRYFCKALSW